MNLGEHIAQFLLEDDFLAEYSQGTINKLISKFKQENPSLPDDDIKTYINRFDSIKGNLPIDKRDITKYSWDELEQTIVSNQSKRIKAGKINDGEPEDANLIYNQDNLRVYVGKTKKACIKYGNGYSFCISARGDGNLYGDYRFLQKGTPYFIFDDSKSSERNEEGYFEDPNHLLVVFYHDDENQNYSVTDANNIETDYYDNWDQVVQYYPGQPKLKNLKDIIKPVESDPKEKTEYVLKLKYNNALNKFATYSETFASAGDYKYYRITDINSANKIIDQLINNQLVPYRFTASPKDFKRLFADSEKISRVELIKPENVDSEYKKFIKDTTDTFSWEKVNDWDIKAKPFNTTDEKYKKYLKGVKQLVDEYNKESAKVKLMKENLNKPIDEFIKYVFLTEYSQSIINQLVDKFKQEKPNLGVDIIKAYINRFSQIKDSPNVIQKDITKYNWKDLETTVDANQPKRIKAGKINDGEPSKDTNLVYNQNGLRIYVGKTKQACIKYGNGYSFCISARGEDNMYNDYRYGQQGTPYFVFDDTKSSEQDKNGKFIDPTHLLVVFIHEYPELADDYNDDEETSYIRYNEPKVYYTVTNADNPGEDRYEDFQSLESDYPELKGLKDVFKLVEVDPKEKAENNLEKKYDSKLGYINESYGNTGGRNYQEGFWEKYHFDTIKRANAKIDDLINNKVEIYRFNGKLKLTANERDYMTNDVSQFRSTKPGNIEEAYKGFIDNIIIPMYNGSDKNHNIVDDWIITYKKTDTTETPGYKKYLGEVKQLVDKYRNELSKIKLMKEGLERKTKLTESQTATIGEFIKYACKNLEIQKIPHNLTLSYDTNAAREKRSFGYFDPNINKIWVYVKNRNMADILRTLAHELVHRKQDEDGRISYESGKTGSDIENEANAKAGILLRDFGKQHEEIYQ